MNKELTDCPVEVCTCGPTTVSVGCPHRKPCPDCAGIRTDRDWHRDQVHALRAELESWKKGLKDERDLQAAYVAEKDAEIERLKSENGGWCGDVADLTAHNKYLLSHLAKCKDAKIIPRRRRKGSGDENG